MTVPPESVSSKSRVLTARRVTVPHVVPRLVLAVGAMIGALLLPLWLLPFLALAAGVALWRSKDAASMRAAGWMGLTIILFTLVVTPFWLTFLAGLVFADALLLAGALAVRLTTVVFIGIALTASVPPFAWLAALRRYPRLAMALTLTFRQVPEFAQDAVRMRTAQRGRGLLVGRRRMRPLVFLVPLFTRAVERADRLSMALVLAGWGEGTPRPVRVPKWTPMDGVWILAGSAVAVVAIWPGLLGLA